MKTHPKTIRTRRNRYLLLVMLVLIVGALTYAGYWWHYCRFRVVSHNAFVTGNLIPVEAMQRVSSPRYWSRKVNM